MVWGELSEDVTFKQRLKDMREQVREVCSKQREHKVQRCLACVKANKESSIGKADR